MDSRLKELLNKYNLHIEYGDINDDGCIIHTPPKKKNLLIIKEGLSDEEAEKVILHEIGHAKNDDLTHKDYKYSYISRVLCEEGADEFLIEEKVKQFVNLNNEPTDANYITLAKSIGTDNYLKVKYELERYIYGND